MKRARPNRNHAWAVLSAIFGYLPGESFSRGAPTISPSNKLQLRRCDPSRHGCLRHGQVERHRKLQRKRRNK